MWLFPPQGSQAHVGRGKYHFETVVEQSPLNYIAYLTIRDPSSLNLSPINQCYAFLLNRVLFSCFLHSGLDHPSFKSASSNKLNDMGDTSSLAFLNSASSIDKKKLLSKSTDALSPSTTRRARPQLNNDLEAHKFSKSFDNSDVKRTPSFLEHELRRTRERLNKVFALFSAHKPRWPIS